MAGSYSHTTRAAGTTLTATIYNNDHQNHVDNAITDSIDDHSSSVAEMKSTTDPGESGSESLATDLTGELTRLRNVIKEITGKSFWYETPDTDLSLVGPLASDNTWTGTNTFNESAVFKKGADVASASPLVLGIDGQFFDVTGTTGFSAITVAAGVLFGLQFDGALTLTHGASLDLPGEANITTAAGDRLIGFAEAANTVQVLSYEKANGKAVVESLSNASLVTAGTALTVDPLATLTSKTTAHGLGAEPTFTKQIIECKVNDDGWTVGERLDAATILRQASVAGAGLMLRMDATNLEIQMGANPWGYLNSAGADTTLTFASWKLEVTPYLVSAAT